MFILTGIIFLVDAFLAAYLLKANSRKKYLLESQIQQLQEKINVLTNQIDLLRRSKLDLEEKRIRYDSLKKLIEEISRNLDLDYVSGALIQDAFLLIAHNRGVCILYLVDNQRQQLNLFKTQKEDQGLVIRAKAGDIFDHWVLKHSHPLLIEDAKKDFRFDLKSLNAPDQRPIASLIATPLVTQKLFLGLLRLDNSQTSVYSQDDLRLLAAIGDLGAVAIESAELFQRTQELAVHDELTNLYTKGFFLDRIKEECSRGLRQKTPLSLLMVDIDYFKNYNDTFGHTVGDMVLKNLSRIIIETFGKINPLICRFGGEEFCVLLDKIDKKQAVVLANTLRENIEKKKIILRRQETSVTVSIGIASFPQDSIDAQGLLQKADQAMYLAKQKGRDQVCFI